MTHSAEGKYQIFQKCLTLDFQLVSVSQKPIWEIHKLMHEEVIAEEVKRVELSDW